jgi:hypothetical protein
MENVTLEFYVPFPSKDLAVFGSAGLELKQHPLGGLPLPE